MVRHPKIHCLLLLRSTRDPKTSVPPESWRSLRFDNDVEVPLGIFIERAVMERTDPKMLLPALLQRSNVYSEVELGNGTGTS